MTTNNRIKIEYFEWIKQLVCNDQLFRHEKLFDYLHNTRFEYTIGMDSNREADGVDLRYRFGYDSDYPSPMICSLFDNRECSFLEMLVALSLRCEENIMNDPEIGDRTGEWFWLMVDNLGLSYMDDDNFNEDVADTIINTFRNHQYKRNGDGGLFVIKDRYQDMRTIEIWSQLAIYLNENYA